jgi:hypothetical protein
MLLAQMGVRALHLSLWGHGAGRIRATQFLFLLLLLPRAPFLLIVRLSSPPLPSPSSPHTTVKFPAPSLPLLRRSPISLRLHTRSVSAYA